VRSRKRDLNNMTPEELQAAAKKAWRNLFFYIGLKILAHALVRAALRAALKEHEHRALASQGKGGVCKSCKHLLLTNGQCIYCSGALKK